MVLITLAGQLPPGQLPDACSLPEPCLGALPTCLTTHWGALHHAMGAETAVERSRP